MLCDTRGRQFAPWWESNKRAHRRCGRYTNCKARKHASAILSRLAEKRHGKPVPHQFKVILPCPSSERGLGCTPFNKCGSFAASCQAALPQPFVCLRFPCPSNQLSNAHLAVDSTSSESGHCYQVHASHEETCPEIHSIAVTRLMMLWRRSWSPESAAIPKTRPNILHINPQRVNNGIREHSPSILGNQ